MTELIHAPWIDDQVNALNAFQEKARMHPFTCGALHTSGRSPLLTATPNGWACPDPECDYTQDWAHAFMVELFRSSLPSEAVITVTVASPPKDAKTIGRQVAQALRRARRNGPEGH